MHAEHNAACMQVLPDQTALQQRLINEDMHALDNDARQRFLRIMKDHKYMQEEGDM